MTETIDYTKYLPTEPPEGLIPYLKRKNKLNDECLVYRAEYVTNHITGKKEKKVKVHCTACGETFYQDYKKIDIGCGRSYAPAPFGFIHSETNEEITPEDITMCPCCCEGVKVYHCGQINRYKTINQRYVLTPYRFGDAFALLGWFIEKAIDNDGNVRFWQRPYEGYIYEGKKCVKVTGRECGFFSMHFTGKWKQLSRCYDTWGGNYEEEIYIPGGNLEYYLQRTSLENSKLDIYINAKEKIYPITYLKLFQRHKNVENLIMQGAGYLISEKIRKTNGGYYGGKWSSDIKDIFWKEKQPSKMFGLTKTEFKFIVKKRHGWEDIEFYRKFKGNGIRPEDIEICKQYKYYNFESLVTLEKNVMKAIRYLERQKKKYPLHESKIGIRYLEDYWEMQEKMGVDITETEIKYPQNLVSSHDAAVKRLKYKESKELKAKFKKRYFELEKYYFELDDLLILPAKNEKELHDEGKILHHCVLTYAKRHAEGKTAIFFIRHKDMPENPYFTLELDEDELKVKQNRGIYNCERTDEVERFEEEWLKHIKKIKMEELKNGKSNDRAAV